MELRTANVVRYIMSLREGRSLSALVETDDDFKYVLVLNHELFWKGLNYTIW
jgi:hypothetical protein